MGIIRSFLFLILAMSIQAAEVNGCRLLPSAPGAARLQCAGSTQLLVQAVTPSMLRIRISPDGTFPKSLPVEFGFVKDDWPVASLRVSDTPAAVLFETTDLQVRVTKNPFQLVVRNRRDEVILQQDSYSGGGSEAGIATFQMAPDDHFFGLGFQRNAFDLRGSKLQWWRAFRSNEATVPFFLSTRGYGFYSNNTYRQVFDFTGANSYSVTSDGGQADYYIIHGPAFRDILDRYTSLTGRPQLAPRWALGIGYQSRYLEEQAGVLKNAAGFRREDLPLDWIGLEPGWEDVPYAMKWNWSPKRFPDPDSMIRSLASIGIKMGLWESGDAPKAGFTEEAVRKEWYAPRINAAIRRGIKFFKQDDPYPRMISSQEWLPPQLNKALGGSGVFTAAELNNLSNSLYSETAMREYSRVTGERAMIMFNGYNSSISSHRWPFTWEADFPLGVGALSASLSGHSLVSTRDRNEAPDGIHLGYLAPFCYLESWAYYKEPWLYSETLLDMNRLYMKLRYRLLPYLYSSHHQSANSGLPVMRPMVLEFQNDPQARLVTTQYMLGDSLLVASARPTLVSGAEQPKPGTETITAQTDAQVYVPQGRWYNFWSGEVIDSKGERRLVGWPASAGGPLLVRGGAILPMGPVTAYSDQEPLEIMRVDVYPAGSSRYVAYEDDGRTYAYHSGARAITEFRSVERPGGLTLSIGARQGSYDGMPARRSYLLSIHTPLLPTQVVVAGRSLPRSSSQEVLLYGSAAAGWYYEPETATLWVKPEPHWRYGYDARGAAGDPDRDTVIWQGTAGAAGGQAMNILIALSTPRPLPKPVFGPPSTLTASLSHGTLLADAVSSSVATVTVRDASGRRVFGSNTAIRIEAEGEATLGCGARVCDVQAADGIATTTVSSTTSPGRVRIRATAAPLQPAEATLTVVRGTIVLKASPPERIKLNSDGSWLPLRLNLYATIYAGGVRLKSANSLLRLHVTGGSGKVPPDLEQRAVEGIATFPNMVLEKPPNYVLHVTGAGLEPASIPVY